MSNQERLGSRRSSDLEGDVDGFEGSVPKGNGLCVAAGYSHMRTTVPVEEPVRQLCDAFKILGVESSPQLSLSHMDHHWLADQRRCDETDCRTDDRRDGVVHDPDAGGDTGALYVLAPVASPSIDISNHGGERIG